MGVNISVRVENGADFMGFLGLKEAVSVELSLMIGKVVKPFSFVNHGICK